MLTLTINEPYWERPITVETVSVKDITEHRCAPDGRYDARRYLYIVYPDADPETFGISPSMTVEVKGRENAAVGGQQQ